MAGFTFSCKSLNHLFSTLAVRCRRDFSSSEEFHIVCLQDFRGTSATFILPTCPELFPNISVTFKTGWLPQFTTLVDLTSPDRWTLDQSSTRSAPRLLSTPVPREVRGSVLTWGRSLHMPSDSPPSNPQPKHTHVEVASFVAPWAFVLNQGREIN